MTRNLLNKMSKSAECFRGGKVISLSQVKGTLRAGLADNRVVPAGEGDWHIPPLLIC